MDKETRICLFKKLKLPLPKAAPIKDCQLDKIIFILTLDFLLRL